MAGGGGVPPVEGGRSKVKCHVTRSKVKWCPLEDMSRTSVAIWWIYHALVAPPGGQVTN